LLSTQLPCMQLRLALARTLWLCARLAVTCRSSCGGCNTATLSPLWLRACSTSTSASPSSARTALPLRWPWSWSHCCRCLVTTTVVLIGIVGFQQYALLPGASTRGSG
jgi:hypothetical protein